MHSSDRHPKEPSIDPLALSVEEDWLVLPPIFGPGVHARATANLFLPSDPPPRAGLSPKRAREFAAGRRCAARALMDAGSREVAVGVGAEKEPSWPAGFVGSITHSHARAGAAVGSASLLLGIGLDFEPLFDSDAMRDAAGVVMSEAERVLPADWPAQELATLVFSAKESLYKCLNPLVRTFFEFADVEVVELSSRGFFRVRLLRDLGALFGRGSLVEGRFAIAEGHVHTAIELRR